MSMFTPPSARCLYAVTGENAKDFLQGMITNDMELLEKQPAIYAAMLTPQGKVISTFFVINNPKGGYWMDCPAGAAEILIKRLSMFRLRADVVFADISANYQLLLGPQTDCDLCFADPRHPQMGYRNWSKISKTQANKEAISVDRFTYCIPEQDLDYGTSEVFPTDINMDLQNGIAWKKGCYVGQEVVSRMKRRGTIRKRIGLAEFTNGPPAAKSEIIAGPAKIGHLCSSNGQQGLVMVRTDRLAKAENDGQEITVNGQSLTVTLLQEEPK